jgi:hypothetical protein
MIYLAQYVVCPSIWEMIYLKYIVNYVVMWKKDEEFWACANYYTDLTL